MLDIKKTMQQVMLQEKQDFVMDMIFLEMEKMEEVYIKMVVLLAQDMITIF